MDTRAYRTPPPYRLMCFRIKKQRRFSTFRGLSPPRRYIYTQALYNIIYKYNAAVLNFDYEITFKPNIITVILLCAPVPSTTKSGATNHPPATPLNGRRFHVPTTPSGRFPLRLRRAPLLGNVSATSAAGLDVLKSTI